MTTAVHERPILFRGPMVRAILDGRKTQTRRPINPQPQRFGFLVKENDELQACPYGAPGDLLWVRETWQMFRVYEDTWNGGYEADLWDGPIPRERPNHAWITYAADDPGGRPWRPSIHMPRWASRITLRVTGAWIERLCEVTTADAESEGFSPIYYGSAVSAIEPFADAWNAMYSKRGLGWSDNPWVWVVEFEKD